ncbi:MAG: hypothetical protein AAGC63_15490, partial [Propionicimonas sp.]|nr:hypothetical protein [Propionicimonas sp.]
MKAIKGFNPDLTCRGFQFDEGGTYEEPAAEVCRSGFHAVTYPLDVFGYYPPATSVYHEVEVDDDAKSQPGGDSKVASKRIRIGARIGIPALVKLAFEYTWSRATLEEGGRATGDRGAASATGDRGAASATGDR